MDVTNSSAKLRQGVYVPVVTPFNQNEDIDIPIFKRNIARLAKADCGLVLSGTLGEGNLLEREEKKLLVKAAKDVLMAEDLDNSIPIIAGINGESLRQCVKHAQDAAEAGADAAVVVAPSYFAFAYGKNKSALKNFFESLADRSPIPLLLYNIPFASGGIDLDPDFLMDIAISKGHRVALHVKSPEYRARHPLPFLVLPGGSDYMLPALVARQDGCVSGPANIYPKVMMKLFRTSVEALETGNAKKFREAQQLQDLVTEADSIINRVGFLGIKTAFDVHVAPDVKDVEYLGGVFRKPLPPPSEYVIETVREGLKKIYEVENSL
ncbi:aldolase [Rhizodiscina lignyota]|uniref:Aldolase n=1 Tax=Rhizodiscina lignyota TaxID=1504668 RepID=A0A9P4INZ0_9PEZI|nr:aldolase [Rhizodiscina lignyota]